MISTSAPVDQTPPSGAKIALFRSHLPRPRVSYAVKIIGKTNRRSCLNAGDGGDGRDATDRRLAATLGFGYRDAGEVFGDVGASLASTDAAAGPG